MSTGKEGFLTRWQRRKLEVERDEAGRAGDAGTPDDARAAPPDETGQAPPAARDERDTPPDEETRQEWIRELEAIDIDKLTYENDFAIFMKSWVPGALRQRALRKLWLTNPDLAVLDGLNDYDLDYTDAAMQAGKVATGFVPGKGYAWMDEVSEKAASLAGDEDGGEDGLPEPPPETDDSVADEAENAGDDAGTTEQSTVDDGHRQT